MFEGNEAENEDDDEEDDNEYDSGGKKSKGEKEGGHTQAKSSSSSSSSSEKEKNPATLSKSAHVLVPKKKPKQTLFYSHADELLLLEGARHYMQAKPTPSGGAAVSSASASMKTEELQAMSSDLRYAACFESRTFRGVYGKINKLLLQYPPPPPPLPISPQMQRLITFLSTSVDVADKFGGGVVHVNGGNGYTFSNLWVFLKPLGWFSVIDSKKVRNALFFCVGCVVCVVCVVCVCVC